MAEHTLDPELLTTDEVAAITRTTRNSVIKCLVSNPGFGFRFGRAWKIPRANVDRVLRGETPAQVAADVRAGGAHRAA